MSVHNDLRVVDQRKHPALVIHQAHPLNAGTPPALVRQSFLTPIAHFFVRNHGSVPQVSAYRYTLSVTGIVRSPLKLSLAELKEDFPASSVIATLQCAGHRRNELATIQPIPGEISWGAEAIGNALWLGVPLREVLLAAGIDPHAKHVTFTGTDTISRGGERFGYGGSIPLEKAMKPEVLLAYAMNGEPLPPLHGFPLRVVVPGYIGARSVKWLANINVQEQPSPNYFQRQAYKLFPPDVHPENVNWERGTMLGDLPLNSIICQPREGKTFAPGPLTISGYAITGRGHQIERVELSIDGGATWTEAHLQARAHPWAWRFWRTILDLRPGLYQIKVRAWDSSGRTQPEEKKQVWNWKGYLNHAWQSINILVKEGIDEPG
jgi:sulfite oxidase